MNLVAITVTSLTPKR